MAITHYIDTSLPEIARSRVKSLTNRVTEAFPVLVYGDTRNHNFVFHNAGTVESFSGGAGYSLRVTLGAVQMGPTKGSYALTCGSSVTVDALSDASTIQAALNGLTTITAEGGVVVTGTFPNFLVTWNTVGVKTAFTVDASLCIPQTGISLVTTQTGSASVVNQVAIVLRQAAISSQSTWTVISSPAAGWTGTITTNSAGALLLLNVLGQAVGNFIEANTVLTAEVLDSNNVPISYYQTPIILRAKNLDPSASVTPPLTTYTLGDMLYGNASGTLTRLAGNTTTTPKVLMQTGTGAVSAAPVWSTASTLLDSVGLTQGSLIYRGASAWAALTPGSAGAMILSGGAGANPAWSTDLTYSTPTLSVPDAFAISSAGSIALTAGGANKNIALTPSGTGGITIGGTNVTSGFGTHITLLSSNVGNAYALFELYGNTNTKGGQIDFGGGSNRFASISGEANTSPAGKMSIRTMTSGSVLTDAITIDSAQQVKIIDATDSTTGTTGSLVTAGGVGIGKSLTVVGPTILLAAAGTNPSFNFSEGGTVTASIQTFNQDLYIQNSQGSKDIIFRRNAGTEIFRMLGNVTSTLRGGAGNMTITAGTGNNRTLTLQTTTSGGTATPALTLNADQTSTFAAPIIESTSALSGAGAILLTSTTTRFTSTGSAQALTLADGVNGQIKRIIHVADGGSGVLTPTTKTGYSTITFTNAGDAVTLQFVTTAGWCVVGSYGVTIAP